MTSPPSTERTPESGGVLVAFVLTAILVGALAGGAVVVDALRAAVPPSLSAIILPAAPPAPAPAPAEVAAAPPAPPAPPTAPAGPARSVASAPRLTAATPRSVATPDRTAVDLVVAPIARVVTSTAAASAPETLDVTRTLAGAAATVHGAGHSPPTTAVALGHDRTDARFEGTPRGGTTGRRAPTAANAHRPKPQTSHPQHRAHPDHPEHANGGRRAGR